MAKRGRKPKVVVPTLNDAKEAIVALSSAKELKKLEQEQKLQIESLYKDLCRIKNTVDAAYSNIAFMDEAESLAAAVFNGGKAHVQLSAVMDKLEEILDNIYDNNDVEYYNDIEDKL